MKKTVVITRSYEDNIILAQKITALNLHPVSSPMIAHKLIACDFAKFKLYQNLIITSKFAAQIVAERYLCNVDAYVVGEESAGILRKNNLVNIKKIYDNVEALSYELHEMKNDRALYLSGDHITEELTFADRYVIYNTEYAKSISPEVLSIISKNQANFIMVYSKNTAENFIDLIKPHIHLQNLQNSVVIAISKEVGHVMKSYVRYVLFPRKPSSTEMFELLVGEATI